jgi:hypothetical protein
MGQQMRRLEAVVAVQLSMLEMQRLSLALLVLLDKVTQVVEIM